MVEEFVGIKLWVRVLTNTQNLTVEEGLLVIAEMPLCYESGEHISEGDKVGTAHFHRHIIAYPGCRVKQKLKKRCTDLSLRFPRVSPPQIRKQTRPQG